MDSEIVIIRPYGHIETEWPCHGLATIQPHQFMVRDELPGLRKSMIIGLSSHELWPSRAVLVRWHSLTVEDLQWVYYAICRYPEDAADDPLHKYETIPLDSTGFVKKKLDTGEEEEGGRYHQGAEGGGGEEEEHSDSVNYGYHPIIDFFTPYRD